MEVSPGAAARRHPYRVVDALNRDWDEIVDSRGERVAGSGRSPVLAGCGGLPEVEARASRGCDLVLHALLSEAREGSWLAARTVLQAMLGRVVRMAGRDRRSSVDEYVAALWCVVVRYPLTARPVRIAANLALDTMKAVHRDALWWPREAAMVSLLGEDLELVLEQWSQRSSLDHQDAATVEAAQVIEAGGWLQILDEPSRALLRLVYVEGLSGAEAAARYGSTPGSVRVRCSRAIGKLSEHALVLAEVA